MKNDNEPVTTLDIRPLLAKGQEPLPLIIRAAADLEDGATLKLLAPFEPLPLYLRMDAMGFKHQTENISDADGPLWMILFSKKDPPPPKPSTGLRILDIRNTPPDTATDLIDHELNALAYDDVLKVDHKDPLPIQPDPEKYLSKSHQETAGDKTVTRIWRRN